MDDKGSFYGWDLRNQIESIIDLYEQGRQEYWEARLGAEGAAIANTVYERAEEFAKAILSASGQLVTIESLHADLKPLEQELEQVHKFPEYFIAALNHIMAGEGSPEDKKKQVLGLLAEQPPAPENEDSPLRLVWERLSIDFAWELIPSTQTAVNRTLQLYGIVLGQRPSRGTQAFLFRLGRCYVWGFDNECVIICRSVLDAGFHDVVGDEICLKHREPKDKNPFSLQNRIKAAWKEGITDGTTRKKADAVRIRGNKAVHQQPGVTKKVWETICYTLSVLNQLYPTNQG